jgi:hypothetical protein
MRTGPVLQQGNAAGAQAPWDSAHSNGDRRSGPDRRLSFRYRVDPLDVLIAWPLITSNDSNRPTERACDEEVGLSASTALVKQKAQMVDLSQTGLSLLVEHLPPSDRSLWIGASKSSRIPWSEVALRSLSQLAPGHFLLRLSFLESCPYELFKAAVLRREGSAVGGG